ncbi:MAG: aldolase/citrate lyase family protein, partial [Kiloniellales bacterium]|nr:aldolase/citrate lyase family protein [Kiloniellales bacterium]
EAVSVMQAVGGNCGTLVRAPSNDPVWIKRILDIGAEGVMIPAVNSAEEANAAARACHYAPRGMRGMAPTIVRASGYGADWKSYVERIEEEVLVICQIESAAAIENVDAIASVEDVDLLFIGPFDLSASLGFLGQPDHPTVLKAVETVEAAAKAHRKHLGSISTPGRSTKDLLQAGYNLIVPDADLLLLRDAARTAAKKAKALVDSRL